LIKIFLDKKIGKYFQKFIISLSHSTYGIYFSHFIFIYVISNYFYPITKNDYINIFYLLIMTLISSWLIILVLSRIPFIKKFSGYY